MNQTALLRYISPICKKSKIARTQHDISIMNNQGPIDLLVIQGKVPDLSNLKVKKIVYVGDIEPKSTDEFVLPNGTQFMSKPVLPSDFEHISQSSENDQDFEMAQTI
ncbi:hypothetical protein [Marinicellulosiphila megalodicopiae]|uniref:hypothetical protein n=1 Tax=Marinicellulosiphila megalodicopiae TaxID=2724896 RepID=UPI003BB007FC